MFTQAKRIVSLLLTICMVLGLLPADAIGVYAQAAAETAEQAAMQQQAAAETISAYESAFEGVAALAAQRLSHGAPEDDGEWQYVVLPEYNYAVITGHTDTGAAQVDIPATLGGADVVALHGSVFAGHGSLFAVTMTGNVYYADKNAVPRGVTVRGLSGSYAQSWAAENLHAFENLSGFDFVEGVVDCSDIAVEHFTRHSETSVTLRALEANRLETGSRFFLMDPDNMYAISFYQVDSVCENADGTVTFACITPEVTQLLNSFDFENATMMADWSTLELAEGVSISQDALQQKASHSKSTDFGASFTLSTKLKNGAKASFTIDYKGTYKMSAHYANLKMDTFKVEVSETRGVTGKLESEYNLDDALEEKADPLLSSDKLVTGLLEAARDQAKLIKPTTIQDEKPLSKVILMSMGGILSLSLDIGFTVEFSGSFEISAKTVTKTTYSYTNGELKSTSAEKENSISFEGAVEAKVGPHIALKVLLFTADIASLKAFAGVKASAKYAPEFKTEGNLSTEGIIAAIEAYNMSLAFLNMLDCVEVKVSFIVELSWQLGGKYLTLLSGSITPLSADVIDGHVHLHPKKFIMLDGKVTTTGKSAADFIHSAMACPLQDAVHLMVPSIDKEEPMGSATLMGASELKEKPELELPDYGVRVKDWYKNILLTDQIQFPYPVKSGERIYGETEEINTVRLIGWDGEPLEAGKLSDGVLCIAESETFKTDDLQLADWEHIVGWVYVKSDSSLTFIGDIMPGNSLEITGDGEDHVLLAIRDNDLTITFKDPEGKVIKELVTGHFIGVEEKDVPAFPVIYDPSYAIALYEWRSYAGAAYEFPYTFDQNTPEALTLYMTPTGIQRVFTTDDTPTVLHGTQTEPSGLTTYSSETYFNTKISNNAVTITGFNSKQKYTDENGVEQTWTAVPEKLVIPAYINGYPVTGISSWAFSGLETLVSVKLPKTLTAIGESAFRNCPALVTLDLSACILLTDIPSSFAYNSPSLSNVTLPGSVSSIGGDAFHGCTALTSASVNASLGESVFEGCTALADVTLLYGVASIGREAFLNCSTLTSLYIPCSVTAVGINFINGCSGLTTLTFDGAPAAITASMMNIGATSSLASLEMKLGVMSIGANAFSNGSYGNPNLTSITLPEALREVGSGALSGTAVEYLKVYDLGMLGTGFAKNCTTLKEVDFEKGVISNYAFDGCTHLEKITMGDSVFAIGDYAFRNCSALTEISVGSGVEYVGDGAFSGCTALVRASFGNNMKTLGAQAFYGCAALQTVDLGNSLECIEDDTFYNCYALTELSLPPSIKEYGEHIIYGCNALKSLTIGGPNAPELTNPRMLGLIDSYALETLVVREGVRVIGEVVFGNPPNNTNYNNSHKNLTSVSLPSTLEEIGERAFTGTSALSTLKLPSSLKIIGDRAFYECSALDLVCPDDLELTSIGEYAFYRCTSLTNINLGHSLESIGDYAFWVCSSLKEANIPESVTNFGRNIFENCSGLTKLTIGGPNTPELSEPGLLGTQSPSALETIVVREGVRVIGTSFFGNPSTNTDFSNGHKKLTSVSLPSTLEEIGERAFYGASALSTLELPSSLKIIGDRAFYECSALDLSCPNDLELTSIGEYAFYRCTSLTNINLGHSLESIGDYAFWVCSSLKEANIPESVTDFGIKLFDSCTGLTKLTIGGPNMPELSDPRILGTQSPSALETIVVREGVRVIGTTFFGNPSNNTSYSNGHKKLTSVSLPSTLEEIGERAFYGASALSTLELPSSLKIIGNRAFYECSALNLVCPNDLELISIGEYAFYKCTSLTNINLGHSLESIGSYAFNDCDALRELTIPPSVSSIGEKIILSCSGLRLLAVGGPGTPVLTASMFGVLSPSVLETLIIGEGVTTLDRAVFSNPPNNINYSNGHRKLARVSLPSTLTTLGERALAMASAVTYLHLPDSITSITSDALSECTALTTLHSSTYNSVIDEFAQAAGIAYTYDNGAPASATLTLMDGETRLYSGEIAAGESIAALLEAHIPEDREGETFLAWQTNADCTAAWRLDSMPSFDLTLYAEMTPTHTVRYSALCGETEIWFAETPVGEGKEIPWPQEPLVAGYHFDGWFTDAAMTQRFTEGMLMGSKDAVVYGKLLEGENGAVYAGSGSATFAAGANGAALTRFVLGQNDSTEVWLPSVYGGEPVVSIAADAFEDAQQITRLHLPDHLADLDPQIFDSLPNLQWITTGAGSENYAAVNGVLYTKDMRTLVRFPQQKPAVSLLVPDSVTAIADGAFKNAAWLNAIALPGSVASLGENAFAGCAKLTAFSAYGLEEIGSNALPVENAELEFFGPIKTGALRDWLLLSIEDGYPVFKAPYNLYGVSLYVDGTLINTLGLEAGSILPVDFVYGEMEDGTVISTWFTDSAMTAAWNREDTTPAADMNLYTASTPIYAYETADFTDADGNTVSGILLTAYNGLGGALVLPRSIGGVSVLGIGENFLAQCQGVVSSVQIGSEVISIADTALNAPQAYPFGGVVKADPESYAAQWAADMGYTVNSGTYALCFETNGGSSIAGRTVAKGAYVKLPSPIKTGDTFLGWYTDEALTTAVVLEDGCYVMPGADTTLYAAWEGTATVWTFDFEENDGEITVTAYTGSETELIIPETVNGMNVTAIADYAFEGNQTLTTVTLPQTLTTVGSYAFSRTAIVQIDLGGTVSLGDGALSGCENLAALHIPASLTEIGDGAFDGCTALASFTADENNPLFSAQDGVLLRDGMTLYRYPMGKADSIYALPENVMMIEASALRGASHLTQITLHDNLMHIGKNAFADCTALTAFIMTDGMTAAAIPDGAFSGCAALETVTLAGRVSSIGSGAFHGCTALTEIIIPDSVTSISDAAIPALLTDTLTLYGVYGSAAWQYAVQNGFRFIDPDVVPVTALTIENSTTLALGDEIVLTAAITPADAEPCGDIRFASSDESVIFIYGSTARAAGAGTAVITATALNGISTSAEFTVLPVGRTYSLSADALTLSPGQSVRFDVLMNLEGTLPAHTWHSSDEAVVSVSGDVLTANAEGSAKITCILSGGKTASAQVTVSSDALALNLPAMLTQLEPEAFAGMALVERIEAGSHLQEIGDRAFADMPALTQITLPASAAKIADDAFSGSANVTILAPEDSEAIAFAIRADLPYAIMAE